MHPGRFEQRMASGVDNADQHAGRGPRRRLPATSRRSASDFPLARTEQSGERPRLVLQEEIVSRSRLLNRAQ